MDIPLPEVNHELSIAIDGSTYSCDVQINAVPFFSYYLIVIQFDLEEKFFEDFDLEYTAPVETVPVENRKNALSNLKALTQNDEWIIETAYKAFKNVEWEFMIPPEQKQ